MAVIDSIEVLAFYEGAENKMQDVIMFTERCAYIYLASNDGASDSQAVCQLKQT